jgi:UDP-N-acetylmuramate--alanine ligase
MGDGEIIVAEADESDGSFLKLAPCIAVITNIDREHLDYYRDIDEIKDAFLQFANIVPFYGSTVLCLDDPHVKEILPQIKRKTITYGMNSPADYRATDIDIRGASTTFTVWRREKRLGVATLNVPGIFNVFNALATIAVAREIDMDFKTIADGLKTFTGVHRRLEVKGTVREVTVIDDYGHHPTEIRETLAAARNVWKGRMIVIFQPHRYTRTKALFQEFIEAFPNADVLILTDIYAASEQPIPGVHAEILAAAIRERGSREVFYMADFREIVDKLLAIAGPGDAIITQGAGTVWKIGEEYLLRAMPQ